LKYQLQHDTDGLHIDVQASEGEQDRLLHAFRTCQNGRCRCPTDEYHKLESLDIERDGNEIHLKLTAKPGAVFDDRTINNCLRYTVNRLNMDA